MTRSTARLGTVALTLLLLAAMSATPARAGQVRVNVGQGGNVFTPYVVNINQGDQVVWVWISGSHNVVNWTLPSDSINFNVDGSVFDSNPSTHFGQTNQRFSWKSDRTGIVTYACVIHIPTMSGRVIITSALPAVPVADFRLTEVQFNVPGGQDLIEIANLGTASGNLGHFRIAVAGTGTGIDLTGVSNDFVVPAGGRVTVHLNASGVNTPPTSIFVPGVTLPDAAGSVALYVPSSLSPQNALTNKDLMIDYVEWGAGGQANETTAGLAGFWSAGTSLNNVAAGHSIEYCASATLQHGADHWAEISPPNFGSNSDCTTPVLDQTWGRLKIIYHR